MREKGLITALRLSCKRLTDQAGPARQVAVGQGNGPEAVQQEQ